MSLDLRSSLLALTIALSAMAAGAQISSEECLGCHSDPSLTKNVNGKAVSVSVDAKKFSDSVHGSLGCADCHADVKTVPHEPAPGTVACAACHADADAAWANSLHGRASKTGNKAAATCLSCHGDQHSILPASNPASATNHHNVPRTCGSCHGQKFVVEANGLTATPAISYVNSVHGAAVAKGNEHAAVCTDCHGSHEILTADNPRSPIFKFNVPATCGKCHTAISKEFMQSIHGKSVARGNWQAPVCTDCHGIHNIKSHIDPASSVAAQNMARTACGQCHGNVRMTGEFGISPLRVKSYEESYHGLAKRRGSVEAANCASCHGVHNILPASDPKSTINKRNLPQTCGKCHPGASSQFAIGKVHLEEQRVIAGSAYQRLFPGKPGMNGDFVLRVVKLIYIPLILLTLGGMALHNMIIWLHKTRKARKDPTRTVVRMNAVQRLQHIFLLTSFITLVISGFALAYPDSWFALIAGPENVRRVIHRIAAVVMLALGVVHIFYMTGTKEGRQGLKDFRFRLKDMRDAVGVMRYHLSLSHDHPKMGRFTYAEKAEYWALVWGTFVMGMTGLMLWFEVQVTTWFRLPRWWVDVATAIHFYEAVLATAAIVIWHLYAVIFDPDAYPLNWAWFDGRIREGQFRHEHEEAWEQMTAADARSVTFRSDRTPSDEPRPSNA